MAFATSDQQRQAVTPANSHAIDLALGIAMLILGFIAAAMWLGDDESEDTSDHDKNDDDDANNT